MTTPATPPAGHPGARNLPAIANPSPAEQVESLRASLPAGDSQALHAWLCLSQYLVGEAQTPARVQRVVLEIQRRDQLFRHTDLTTPTTASGHPTTRALRSVWEDILTRRWAP